MDLQVEPPNEEAKGHKKHKYKHGHRHGHKHKEEDGDCKDSKGRSKTRSKRSKNKDKHRDRQKDKLKDKTKNKDTSRKQGREKGKERRGSSKTHKKRKKGRNDEEKKSREKCNKRKRRKAKERNKFFIRHERALDLSTLTGREVKALRKVIKKDEAEMRAMDLRVSIIRNQIEELRQLNAECIDHASSRSSSNTMCPRCGKEFPAWQNVLPFVDKGVRCETCKYLVCKNCRYPQPNGLFLCRLCICYRQERLLTGEWMDPCVGGVHSTDLIKLSLRDKKFLKKRRKKDQKRRAEQSKKVTAERTPEGYFEKKRRHRSRRKKSRSKSKKSKDDNNTSRRRRKHRHGVRGHHRSGEERERVCASRKEGKSHRRSKDALSEGKMWGGGEGPVVYFDDEVAVEEAYEDENEYFDNDDYYGADFWQNSYYNDDTFDYNYDGYYFEGEGEDEGYEEEADNKPNNPEKEDLALEVSVGRDASYWPSMSLGSRHFHRLGEPRSYSSGSQMEQVRLMRRFLRQEPGGPKGKRLPCMDYLPMSKPPPYQERCPDVWPDLPGVPAAPAYGNTTSAQQERARFKHRRNQLFPLWRRIKFSIKETFRFVMPSFIRRDKCSMEKEEFKEKMADEEAAVSVEINNNEKLPVSVEDINWNFQPRGGGPHHGGGRKGAARGGRGRGRGRGQMRGRGMRGRGRGGRGGPYWGRGARGAWRGARGGRGRGRGRGSGREERAGKKSKKDKKDKKSKKGEKAKKARATKAAKAEADMVLAIVDLQKKLKGKDADGRISKGSAAGERSTAAAPADGTLCPPKDTESVASQTSKPRRTKFMEFFCPFCRFNVEWT